MKKWQQGLLLGYVVITVGFILAKESGQEITLDYDDGTVWLYEWKWWGLSSTRENRRWTFVKVNDDGESEETQASVMSHYEGRIKTHDHSERWELWMTLKGETKEQAPKRTRELRLIPSSESSTGQ